jgi:hypothetical protein
MLHDTDTHLYKKTWAICSFTKTHFYPLLGGMDSTDLFKTQLSCHLNHILGNYALPLIVISSFNVQKHNSNLQRCSLKIINVIRVIHRRKNARNIFLCNNTHPNSIN